MDSFTNLVEEMKRLYKVSSLEDVAEKMGYSKKNATNWRKNRKLSAHAQLKWLEAKNGQATTTLVARDSDNNGNTLSIPLLSAKASAGHGIENFEVEAIGEFSISPMLFRTHQSPHHLRFIEVVGDSMSPTLKDGDFVLIDTSKTGGAQDGIYVLILGCDLLVKRLQFELNGDIRILSDNPHYAEKLYTQESQIPLRIVGIVIRAIVRF